MTVVAAVDDSERASTVLAHASSLASDLSEPLHAIYVLRRADLVNVLEKEVEGQAVTENYEVKYTGERIVMKAIATEGTVHDHKDIETIVRVGDPAEEIRSYAEEVTARYIVVGGRRRTPTGKALFGSVTQRVILTASVPVLNVPIPNR
ncbi:universal stress protein [Halegenticoccus tardaugens]|uniref:universal stress protein n=1 Tax=Halegenticoccus tardaugens TaxID=2071624 RepID=UPI00100A81A2|nr:universal stress protein [Halegenticoccus tardaugens]